MSSQMKAKPKRDMNTDALMSRSLQKLRIAEQETIHGFLQNTQAFFENSAKDYGSGNPGDAEL